MPCYQCDEHTIEEIEEIRAARDAEVRAYNAQLIKEADDAVGLNSKKGFDVPFFKEPFEDKTDESTFVEGPVTYDEWNQIETAQGDVAEPTPKRAGRPKKAAAGS